MLWRAVAGDVVGRGAGDEIHLADAPRDQALVLDLAGADGAVEIFGQQVGGRSLRPRSSWISG
jgi:hypothetical protein